MQYGGNQQQRFLNMMMQARQQQAVAQRQGAPASLYSSSLYPLGLAQQQQLRQASRANFVTSVGENDVLLGRGTPCAENEGNVRFRKLVKERKMEYIAAEKRMRKDAIAREILDVIAARGGKFLRKLESTGELERLGVPHRFHSQDVWAVVNEDTQVQKVKQALRNKDDAAEIMASNTEPNSSNSAGEDGESSKVEYLERDVTNRFPRGVADDSNIQKADCNMTSRLGKKGVLERASSGSSADSSKKAMSSPKVKAAEGKDVSITKDKRLAQLRKGPAGDKSTSNSLAQAPFSRQRDGMLSGAAMDTTELLAMQRRGSLDPATAAALASPANQRSLYGGLSSSSLQFQAAPSEAEMIRLQEMQRISFMRGQMGGMGGSMGGLDASVYGAGDLQRAQMMNAEYRQMQMAQQMQMAAAREQAAMASLRPIGPMHPSAAMAAHQRQMESAQRRASLTGASKGKAGADSAGERAIGIAQAMKRAEAFSPSESLEVSHLETLILSVLCSHGLPVWTPEAHSKAFVALALPTFAKRLDWTWYGFASVLKQIANSKGWSSGQALEPRDKMAVEAAVEYQRDPRELATKTIMLMEKLRRYGSAATGTSQRKKHSGLGTSVPQWLDRELSRWAMTLDIADPSGRPVAFSSTDFVTEHIEYKDAPVVMATAAFDPQLADDVLDQVALLTRLRSVFVKTKGPEIKAKIERAILGAKEAGESWEGQPAEWSSVGNDPILREILLCDRLLSEGFSNVLSSSSHLGAEHQLGYTAHQYPSFDSLALTKSSVQQRASQIVKVLHTMEESKDLKILRLDRMERLAQSVISSSRSQSQSGVTSPNLAAVDTDTRKRRSSIDLALQNSAKRQMIKKP